MAVAALAGPVPLLAQGAPAAPATGGAPANGAAARSKASLEPVIRSGMDALLGGQTQAAREAFQDALSIDPRNVKAQHGLALSHLLAGDNAKARETFEKALLLSPQPDRALVLNAAGASLATKNAMRAAKLVRDYLSAHTKEPDEQMVNALGTALMAATPNERKNRFFVEFAAFYEIVNKRLEAARPGYKRFGMDWYRAAEADAKSRAIAAQQKNVTAAYDRVGMAEERLEAARKELARQEDLARRGEGLQNYYLQRAQSAFDTARTEVDKARSDYEALLAAADQPKFPRDIGPVAIDSLTPPPLAEPVAVASAAGADTGTTGTPGTPGTGTTGTGTTRRPRRPVTGTTGTGTGTGTGTAATGTGTTGTATTGTPGTGAPGTGTAGTPAGTGTAGTTAGAGTPTTGTPTPANPTTGNPTVAIATDKPRKVRVTQYAAAFAVAPDLVVTAAAAADPRATLQLQTPDGQSCPAKLVRKDEALGLALVRIEGKTLPCLSLATTFAGGPVACPAFPTVDLFNPTAQLIAGTAQAPKDAAWSIGLERHPRLAGSPVLAGGKVVGVCTAARDADRQKLKAIPLEPLRTFLGQDANPLRPAADPATALVQLVSTRESESGE